MDRTLAEAAAAAANVQVRGIDEGELETFLRTMSAPYGFDPAPERLTRLKNCFDVSRFRAAFDGEQMVATFGSLALKMTVPGGAVPTAGTSVVSVAPTHRRRGIMRALMAEHLADVHARGEPLAGLWASESSIYGRFGYGLASERMLMKLEKPFARFAQPASCTGSLRLVEVDEALRLFPAIFDQMVSRRPGMFARSPSWWKNRNLADPDFLRMAGATAHRRAVYVRDNQPAGYVIYRTRREAGLKPVELQVVELLGLDQEAERALWQFVFGVDLVDSIYYWNQPLDDPLRWWLEQPRRMDRRIEDALWLRPVDVAVALAARTYSSAGRVIFCMRDEQCPWNAGVFALETDERGAATCQHVDRPVEVELTPYALGCTYLGGQSFQDLAAAGIISGSPEALRQLDAMFAWRPVPWCQEVF